ncbi:MAG: DUF1573 domain-containing protein [Chitinophagaceae bacterium]
MRNTLVLFAISLLFTHCASDNKKANAKHDSLVKKAIQDTTNYTAVQWLDTSLTFGTIKQGEKITLKFRCKNTGLKPLILTNVRPGCGCTIADYSKEAILPGKEGWVTANFDSKRFCGDVHKSLLVSTNTNNDNERNLQFTGNITNCENDKIVQPHPVTEEKKSK